ncbi:MAG: ROK family transcriptional regulator [Spirochaetales bacterium]|uniref:ROK family transcriptional regulator n=1 Tax=Candidatus Thalassospirochaeta sargassi TaxID=3119039 RepID=A0AAJ1MPG8_9SPIO|nr:ROK family transcriptional regulator [Spirochaetales bacterium]
MRNRSASMSNTSRVLRTIWLNDGISRIEIAEKLMLDKSTITNITASLQEKNIVTETETGEAGPHGGRKPIKLKILENYSAVMGIEVQPECCNVVCVNLAGEILLSKQFHADITAYSFPDVFSEILSDMESQLSILNIPLAGIGLGMSGIINPDKGIIYKSIPLGVTEEYAVLDDLEKRTNIPIFIDNDGNCCCWGEILFNKSQDLRDFLFTMVEFREHNSAKAAYGGLAVGMGIVIDGKVHHGKTFTAGEFRSVFAGVESCGQFSFGKENEFRVKKDPELFNRFSIELSRNIALIANTFALSECFLGGDLHGYEDVFTEVLKTELDKNWAYPGDSVCEIRFSSLEEKAVAYGAASMIIDRLFKVPGPEVKDPELSII